MSTQKITPAPATEVDEVAAFLGVPATDTRTKSALADFMGEWNQMHADADAADAEFDRKYRAHN